MKSEWYGDKVLNDISDKLYHRMKLASAFVQGEAKRRAPKDTGRLYKSITKEVRREGKESVGIIGTNVEYAIFQEYGTSKMSAQPYLRPSILENKKQIISFLNDYRN